MSLRTVTAILAFGLFVAAMPMVSAQPAKVPLIGFLGMDSQMQAAPTAAFVDGLRELGYVDGRNISIQYRWAEGRFDRLPELAAELVALKPDVIVTAAPPAVRAAQRATKTIPIVMTAHDPVGMGFVDSLARPGGNITGVAFQDVELTTKRLDLLRQTVPNLTRVAVLWNKEGSGGATLDAVGKAAQSLGLQIKVLEVTAPGDFAKAIDEAKAWRAQGVVQLSSPFITKHRAILLDLLKANRLPATCEMRWYVAEGCLMTYSADIVKMLRRLAYFVDRILKGANPAELAIEQPQQFDFLINFDTAQALGLSIPSSLRMQMTENLSAR
jgi:putative ABC transport system substrate-binding protein